MEIVGILSSKRNVAIPHCWTHKSLIYLYREFVLVAVYYTQFNVAVKKKKKILTTPFIDLNISHWKYEI